MSLYERIEQEGLTSEQVNHLFREEMVRYRNMLAHQLAVIEKDGLSVPGLARMRSIMLVAVLTATERLPENLGSSME